MIATHPIPVPFTSRSIAEGSTAGVQTEGISLPIGNACANRFRFPIRCRRPLPEPQAILPYLAAALAMQLLPPYADYAAICSGGLYSKIRYSNRFNLNSPAESSGIKHTAVLALNNCNSGNLCSTRSETIVCISAFIAHIKLFSFIFPKNIFSPLLYRRKN